MLPDQITTLALELKLGETICFSVGVDKEEIRLTLLEKSGQRARFMVLAPAFVRIKSASKQRPG